MPVDVRHLQSRSIILLLGTMAVVICVTFWLLRSCSIDLAGHYDKRISGEKGNLFIKGLATGITRDHQVWWITTRETSVQPDTAADYVWRGLQPFFFKFQLDTLFLLVRQKTVKRPISFDSQLELVQRAIEIDEYNYLRAKGDSLGWTRAEM